MRQGEWAVGLVESGDIHEDGWLKFQSLREIGIVRSPRTDRYLLRPFDVLVTARAESVQVALVPPQVSRTVAGVTLLVVRPKKPEAGMGHYLWYFLTSAYGRRQMLNRLTVNATITSLSARSLGEIELPVPSSRELDLVARLAESSGKAYAFAVEAARLRRDTIRDAVIDAITTEGEYQPI